ncbi:MAG: ATP synthase F1 subunit delta [Candidatus Saccharimonadales bacterium]
MAGTKFSRRVIARTVARKLVQEPARQEYWMRTLAAYLVEQKRVSEADLVVNDILHELHAQDGQLLARVTSARPLAESVRTSLRKILAEKTGAKKVILTEEIDPSLIGGLTARTADAELDASVRTKLNRLATIN